MNILSTTLLSSLLLISCNKIDEGKMMRRFAFAKIGTKTNLVEIEKATRWIKTNNPEGIIDFEYYELDTIQFVLLDMKSNYDFAATQKLISNMAQENAPVEAISDLFTNAYKPIERIYKLEQKKAYSASKGQLIPITRNSKKRFTLTLEIVNNQQLAQEYKEVHDIGMAWTEITQNIKTVGIHEMEIYMLGYRAFLIMDAKPNFTWEKDGEIWSTLPREKEWQSHVAKFQKTNPDSKAAEKWAEMDLIK
ncbi:MAG: L-rhamnose mutarotase [Labilibaculum sp.]|nr:L-rhamnose mutarotase [Labilibaculum sp.]MBI9057565.1 L-rhamnose mutarotase [Labilibaculum sp.]